MIDTSNLSEKELRKLKSEIEFQLLKYQTDNWYLFKDCLEIYLKNKIGKTPFTGKFVPEIKKVTSFLDSFVDENTSSITRTERTNFYMIYCNLIGEWLESIKMPLTPKNILLMYDHFPDVLDRAFPGYVRSGLLKIIVEERE